MNKTRFTGKISRVLGKMNWARLLSSIKYLQKFTHEYKIFGGGKKNITNERVIFMIDGKTIHGGLSDRLRGLLATYSFAKKSGKDFFIYWVYPFKLENYLEPANFDWRIKEGDICRHKKDVKFCFVNSYSHLNNDENHYFKLLKTHKPETHVYSNVTLHEEDFAELMKELFKPTKPLESVLKQCREDIGTENYISITFRFQALLGDLREDKFPTLDNDKEKSYYIERCLTFIHKIKNENKDTTKILVTSDSNTFLSYAKKLGFVYIIPGKVEHMDYGHNNDFDVHLKSFVDLFMIADAQQVYAYSFGKMFGHTRFAKTASLIGNKTFIHIKE